MTDVDHAELKRLAEGATPGNLDTVPNPSDEYGGHSTGFYECPACGGQSEVEGTTYCNFDGVALGVQFFGIGNEHKNYEAFFRAANPAVVLALLSEIEGLKAECERTRLEAHELLHDELTRTQAPDSWRPIAEHDNSADEVLVMAEGWTKPIVAWRHHPSSRTDMWLTVPGRYQVKPTEFHPLPILRPQTAESGQ